MKLNVGLVVMCLLLLVLKINSSEVKSVIPEGYKQYGDGGFYKYHEDATTWHIARQICENENAHLVIINSQEELDSIGDMMNGHNVVYIHAGFDDLVTEGEYYTIYGEPLSQTYVKWADNEPNNGRGENCGSISTYNSPAGLNDIGCESIDTFICELKA